MVFAKRASKLAAGRRSIRDREFLAGSELKAWSGKAEQRTVARYPIIPFLVAQQAMRIIGNPGRCSANRQDSPAHHLRGGGGGQEINPILFVFQDALGRSLQQPVCFGVADYEASSKSVYAAQDCAYPDIPETIFKEAQDAVAREHLRNAKDAVWLLVVAKQPAGRANPKVTL